jgi:hypothetical protein
MREWSTPLRGSSSSENRSLLSGSRTVLAASTFDSFAVDGSANRFSTSGSQRSCAVRSFEVRSVELARPKPRVAMAVTTKITTQPAAAAINHARVVNLRGVGPELLIGYPTKVPGVDICPAGRCAGMSGASIPGREIICGRDLLSRLRLAVDECDLVVLSERDRRGVTGARLAVDVSAHNIPVDRPQAADVVR